MSWGWIEETEHLQSKRIIRVRTSEGARKYGQAVGTVVRTGKDKVPGSGGTAPLAEPARGPKRPPRTAPNNAKPTATAAVSTVAKPKSPKVDKRTTGGQTKGNFVHPVTGHRMGKTEIGDTFEQLFQAKMKSSLEEKFGCCLKLITGAGEGTARNTPLDFRVGKRGGEVKTLSARSKNQKTAIKKEEVERKHNACEALGVEPVLIAQVVDQETGEVRVYGHPAFESKAVTKMTFLGGYKFNGGDFQKAQEASGHWGKAPGRAAAEQAKATQTKALGEPYDPPDEEGGIIEAGDTVIELREDGEGRIAPFIYTQGEEDEEEDEDEEESEAKHLPGLHDQDRHGQRGRGGFRSRRPWRVPVDASRALLGRGLESAPAYLNEFEAYEALGDGLPSDYQNPAAIGNRAFAKREVADRIYKRLSVADRTTLADRGAAAALRAKQGELPARSGWPIPFHHNTLWSNPNWNASELENLPLGEQPWEMDVNATDEQGKNTGHARAIERSLEGGWHLRRGDDPIIKEAMARAAISDFIHTWASTSNDENPRSLAVQEAARLEFGLDDVHEWEIDPEHWGEIMMPKLEEERANIPLYRRLLRAQYDETQQWLRDHGITEIVLHRGMAWEPDDPVPGWRFADGTSGAEDEGPPLSVEGDDVRMRPLSAWSVKRTEAQEFASRGDNGILLSTVFPAELIFSTPRTGFGCLPEYEFVVLAPAEGSYRAGEW